MPCLDARRLAACRLTNWKKNVALFACRAACESTGVAERRISFCAASVGVADSFLMSYMAQELVSDTGQRYAGALMCMRARPWPLNTDSKRSDLAYHCGVYHRCRGTRHFWFKEQWKREACLFESFVVDEACGVFRDLQLSLLDLFAELPAAGKRYMVSCKLPAWERGVAQQANDTEGIDLHVARQRPRRPRVG